MKQRTLHGLLAMTLCITMALGLVSCGKAAPEPEAEAVTEEEPSEEEAEEASDGGTNLLENGDFSNGTDQWFTYCSDGEAALSVTEDGELDVNISNLGTVEYGVQLYHDGFGLDEGCDYQLSFDAYATMKRPTEMRFQINGGDYHAYYSEKPTLMLEKQHYDFYFTMNETSDPAPRFCFNIGKMAGVSEEQQHIYFDNFVLTLADDSNRVVGSGTQEVSDIAVDQIGYLPKAYKSATLRGAALNQTAKLIDESTGKSVLEAKIDGGMDDPDTGEKEAAFDFTKVTAEGTYHVEAGDVVSPTFKISKDVYNDALKASLKMFYYQRCGEELPAEYAGDWAHPACHVNNSVLYENSSLEVDVSGGWHDAGDYGRYSVAGATAAADLLLAYENYPQVFDDAVGIPESGNGVPDVLDEAKYELDWLMKMQRDDGAVYHKVSCRSFPGEVMPQDETDQMVVMYVSTTATGDFAGVMAIASRVYAATDPSFAKKCLDASKKAATYLMGTDRDTKGYRNPGNVSTGEYEDANDIDERFWAYAELYKTTGDIAYEQALQKEIPTNGYTLGWQGVGGYGMYAYMTCKGFDNGQLVSEAERTAKEITDNANTYSYGSSIVGDYPWGSNLTIANNGQFLLMMKQALGKTDQTTIDKQLHYLFGNNATGYCFMTGFGTVSPQHPHHRPSQSTMKTVPGMIVGGPNNGLNDPFVQNVLKDTPRAKCYADNGQSYSTNEITIYWNSPVVYLLAGEMAETK